MINNLDPDLSSLIDLIKCWCAFRIKSYNIMEYSISYYTRCLKEIRRLGGVVACAAVGGELNYNGDGSLALCVCVFSCIFFLFL